MAKSHDSKYYKIRILLHRFSAWIHLKQYRNWIKLRNPKNNLKLHIGCGNIHLNNYINIDRNYSPATDFVTNARKIPCKNNSVKRIETYHLIEHIPQSLVIDTLSEWYRILIPSGTLIIECPDFDKAVREYIAGNNDRLYSIFGRQRFPGDTHNWGYNAKRLKDLLKEIGFAEITENEAQDYHKDHEPCIRIEAIK